MELASLFNVYVTYVSLGNQIQSDGDWFCKVKDKIYFLPVTKLEMESESKLFYCEKWVCLHSFPIQLLSTKLHISYKSNTNTKKLIQIQIVSLPPPPSYTTFVHKTSHNLQIKYKHKKNNTNTNSEFPSTPFLRNFCPQNLTWVINKGWSNNTWYCEISHQMHYKYSEQI